MLILILPYIHRYSEIKKYSYMRPRFSSKTGHFTQLVWVEAKTVGMAIAKNDTRAVVVANYTPQVSKALCMVRFKLGYF